MTKEKNIKEATEKWVGEFNAIPMFLMEKAYGGDNFGSLEELTKQRIGDYVYVFDLSDSFEIKEVYEDYIMVEDSEGEKIKIENGDYEVEDEGGFPMWGTMWTFGNSLDSEWVLKNLQTVSDLGFRIYEDYENGEIYIGIDGAGYDFYEAHWIPLYKARGLQWHNFM